MHYIYHIPERRKIGVTTNLARRMNEHKWTEAYIILEQHEDAKVAGDREWELQDQHGYPRDNRHYTFWLTLSELSNTNESIQKSVDNRNYTELSIETKKKISVARTGKKQTESFFNVVRNLTMEDARNIRFKYSTINISMQKLAKEYNTTSGTIFNIVHKKSYKEIE